MNITLAQQAAEWPTGTDASADYILPSFRKRKRVICHEHRGQAIQELYQQIVWHRVS